MKKSLKLIIPIITYCTMLYGEDFYQNQFEKHMYKIYTTNKVINVYVYNNNEIEFDSYYYGFSNDCESVTKESLSDKGSYYIEIDGKYLDDYSCDEQQIFQTKKGTFMNIYSSSRQQYVTYKKIKKLPKKVVLYMKEKGIL